MNLDLFNIGLALISIGFFLAFLSVLVLSIGAVKDRRKVKGGGIVMIGPIPIVFGTDKDSLKVLILLTIIMMILVFALTWFFR
ncbi:MAG: DUF131 domain-containing protein [Candidatus Bathyarchaeia archaeon]